MAGLNNQAFGRIDGVATKNNRELADELGTHAPTISSIKSGERGLSPELARAVATKSGEKAGNVYLESQVARLKQKVALKRTSPAGTLHSCGIIMKSLSGGFRPSEMNRKDPSFRKAAQDLKAIAEAALDLAEPESMGPKAGSPNDAGVVHHVGESVEPALKSQRDPFGKAIQKGEQIERDAMGRRIK
jgi:hypothetical protein